MGIANRVDTANRMAAAKRVDAAKLFDAHHAELVRYLVRLTGDRDLAADAAQEAFARLVTHPPRDEKPRAWLFTVATNVVRAGANSGKRQRELLEARAVSVPAAVTPAWPDEEMQRNELRRTVRTALGSLSDKERTVLLMREEGFSHREIAASVGTTTGSVGTMIARALDKLAERLPLDAEDL